MSKLATNISVGVTAVLVGVVGALLLEQQPSTEELESDLKNVRLQLARAAVESDKYSGGALKNLIEVRRHILLNTEAMLDQKKTSLLRRVSLGFSVNGREATPASDASLKRILQEIESADNKLSASVASAEGYSGGLVQAMALITAETDRMSVAQLRLKYYSMKHGMPLLLSSAEQSQTPKESPGKSVNDRDANL